MMGFPGLVTTVCPLPKTHIDCVPGNRSERGLLVIVPGTVPPVVPEVPGVTAFAWPVGPTERLSWSPQAATVMGFPGLVTMVCPLPKTPIDCVPGTGVSGLLVVVPGTVPPVVPEVPGVTAFVWPVGPTKIVVVPGGVWVIGLLGLVTVVCPAAKRFRPNLCRERK